MIRTWWATAAVLAIFAMHGLATHASAHEPGPVAPMAGVHETSGGAAHDVVASTHDDDHQVSAIGLCLAVLATAAIALLRVVRPRSGLLALRPRAVALAPPPVAPGAGHGPPDLHALSIMRC